MFFALRCVVGLRVTSVSPLSYDKNKRRLSICSFFLIMIKAVACIFLEIPKENTVKNTEIGLAI
jgi:hypothetical protein